MTVNARLDENSNATITCISNADGATVVRIQADFATNSMHVSDGTSGTDKGNNLGNAFFDENSRPVWFAVSSADGSSPIEVYGDPATGSVLVNSH